MGLPGLRSGPGGVSERFKRKDVKKHNFYGKVKDAVVSLAAKKTIGKKKKIRSRQKKLKAYDLSTLSECLSNVDVQPPQPVAAKFKLNCKSMTKLVEKESEQLKAILTDPAFQQDPISYIHQHLERTLPPVVDQEKQLGKTGKKGKRKQTKRSSSMSQQSMEL